MARPDKDGNNFHTSTRFKERTGGDWVGELIDYKEVELLRKFLSPTSKLMSRRRAGTNAQEQAAVKRAVKRARLMALIPYAGS